MDIQVFGESLSVTVLQQDDRLKLLTGKRQTQLLLNAFDVEEWVRVDGFACHIVVMDFHGWSVPGFQQEVYVVDLLLEVMGEEA